MAEGGEYSENTEKKMRVKYRDEMRFALSVAQVKKKTAQLKGAGSLSSTTQDRLLFLIRRKNGALKKNFKG